MKKLVVYYSYTGNTKKPAKIIAEKIGAETLEIETERHIQTTMIWWWKMPRWRYEKKQLQNLYHLKRMSMIMI